MLFFADKEALRKQAADAMKAVEMRSLTLLQSSLGGSKNARGTPMAANRPHGSTASLASNTSGTGTAEPPPPPADAPPAEPAPAPASEPPAAA